MSDRSSDERPFRFPSPNAGRGERNVDASTPPLTSYKPTEHDASTAFKRGLDAAGIRLANGRNGEDFDTPEEDTPEKFVKRLLAERDGRHPLGESAVSRLLNERRTKERDKGLDGPS